MIDRGPGFLVVAHPIPSPISKMSLFFSLPVCRLSHLLTGEWRGGAKSWPQESLALYTSFNTLCLAPTHSHTFSFHQLKHTQPKGYRSLCSLPSISGGGGWWAISEISVSASDTVSGAAVGPFSLASERRNPSMN
jgi:hypothetical protein